MEAEVGMIQLLDSRYELRNSGILLEAGNGREIDCPADPPEGSQSHQHFNFSPVRLPLNF